MTNNLFAPMREAGRCCAFWFTAGHLDYPVIKAHLFTISSSTPLLQLFEYTEGLNTNQSPWQHTTVNISFKYDNKKNCTPPLPTPLKYAASCCLFVKMHFHKVWGTGTTGCRGERRPRPTPGGVWPVLYSCFQKDVFLITCCKCLFF